MLAKEKDGDNSWQVQAVITGVYFAYIKQTY